MVNIKNIIVRPKDASSLIILKKNRDETFVLMGKRPLSSRFMPGVFVFPGGVLEKEDRLANKFFNLKSNSYKNKNNFKANSISHAQSLLLTAIRETAEETGLYLAKKKNYEKKQFNISNSTWQKFIKNLYFPSIDKLFFFGRAITPSTIKIRFHARFFIAFYENFIGEIESNGELEDIGWYSLKDAKKNNIADVTEFIIDEISKYNNNYSKLPYKKSFPMFTWKYNKRSIKWDKSN